MHGKASNGRRCNSRIIIADPNCYDERLGQADPASMKPNDFIYVETEQRIEQQQPKVVLQEGVTVSRKIETNNEFNYTFLYQTAVLSGEQTQQSTQEDHRCVAKNNLGCAPSATDPNEAATLSTSQSELAPAALKAFTKMKELAIKPMASDQKMTLGFEKFANLAYACQTNAAVAKYCVDKLGADTCDISCSNLTYSEELQDVPLSSEHNPIAAGLQIAK